MNENLTTPYATSENPVVTVTKIVTYGVIACVFIVACAKYNRDGDLKIGEMSLNINPLVPAIPATSV